MRLRAGFGADRISGFTAQGPSVRIESAATGAIPRKPESRFDDQAMLDMSIWRDFLSMERLRSAGGRRSGKPRETIRPAASLVIGLAVFLAAAPASAEGMSFRLVTLDGRRCGTDCPQVIAAEGEIVRDTPDAFSSFVGAHAGGRLRGVLLLDSLGGKVVASMELGRALRRLGMAVVVARLAADDAQNGYLVAGRCYSACVYALMGGRKRVIPPQSKVGVHRMFVDSTHLDLAGGDFVRERTYADDGMRALLMRYSHAMGVSGDLISLAERTSSDRVRVLTAGEIARWRLGSPKL